MIICSRWVWSEDFCGRCFFEIDRNMLARHLLFLRVSSNCVDLGSIIEMLGSKYGYLHEKCGTNPSRHFLGLKTLITDTKIQIWGLGSLGGKFSISEVRWG